MRRKFCGVKVTAFGFDKTGSYETIDATVKFIECRKRADNEVKCANQFPEIAIIARSEHG